MTRVGFSVFGRPAIHEYCSNGLINDTNLNSETYLNLPNGVHLSEGQKLAILKRYKDSNGIEVISVFINDFAIDAQSRPGAFVGSGLAFVGRPTPKLIVNTLSQLHKQSLSLIDPTSGRFKESRIDCNRINLPDINAKGYFYESYPKKFRNSKELNIGINVDGNFFENLMTAVQGFMYNDSFQSVTTAYISQDKNLLQSIVPKDRIYNTYRLLDFSTYFNSQEEKKKALATEISAKNAWLSKFEDSKRTKEREIGELVIDLERVEKSVSNEKGKFLNEEKQFKRLIQNKKDLQKDIEDLKKHKSTSFKTLLESPGFEDQKAKYEASIKSIEKGGNNILNEENEELKKKRRKLVLFLLILSLFTLLILMGIGATAYKFRHNISNNLFADQPPAEDVEKQSEQTNSKVIVNTIEFSFPVEYSANDFLVLSAEKKKEHKHEIDEIIKVLNVIDSSNTSTAEPFLNRKWNFREVLDEGDEKSIDSGLGRMKEIKEIYTKFNKKHKYDKVFLKEFLIEDLIYEKNTMDFTSPDLKAILIEYLNSSNNIYTKKGIKPLGSGNDILNEDPILFMHFRWIYYNISADKQDFIKSSKTKHFIPIVKEAQ